MIIGIADDANGGSKILVGSRVEPAVHRFACPLSAASPVCNTQLYSVLCIPYSVFRIPYLVFRILYSVQNPIRYTSSDAMAVVDSKSGNAPFRAESPLLAQNVEAHISPKP